MWGGRFRLGTGFLRGTPFLVKVMEEDPLTLLAAGGCCNCSSSVWWRACGWEKRRPLLDSLAVAEAAVGDELAVEVPFVAASKGRLLLRGRS